MILGFINGLCLVVIDSIITQKYTINKEQYTISYSIDELILDNEYYLNLTLNTTNYSIFSHPMNLTNVTIKGNIYVLIPNVEISLFFHPSLKQTVQLSLLQIDITYHGKNLSHSLMSSPGSLQILNSQIRFDFNVVSLQGSLLLKNANDVALAILNTQIISNIRSEIAQIGVITNNITEFKFESMRVYVEVNYTIQQRQQSIIDLFVGGQQPNTSHLKQIQVQNPMMSQLISNIGQCYCYYNKDVGKFVGIQCNHNQCNQNQQ